MNTTSKLFDVFLKANLCEDRSRKTQSCRPENHYLRLFFLVGLALLLTALPFRHNKAIVYASETLLALVFLVDISKEKKAFFLSIKNNPFNWIIIVYSATAFLSVLFSHNPFYSFKQFIYEIVINVLTFYVIIYLLSRYLVSMKQILQVLVLSNIIFITIYFLQGVQWCLMPYHPVMSNLGGKVRLHNFLDIFNYLRHCSDLFSYKSISTCLLFFVAMGLGVFFSPSSSLKSPKIIVLTLLNLFIVVFSTLKAPVVAICFSAILACFFPFNTRKRIILLAASILITVLLAWIMIMSPLSSRFMRGERVSEMLHGKFHSSGSFGSRVLGYKLYLEHIFRHPFTGVGIGRRNIKKALPDLVAKTGFSHGHNVFINTAIQQGIQSAIALIIFIILQFKHGITALKKLQDHKSPEFLYLSTYLIWLCMFWIRSSFDDMFRHSISTFYWVLAAFFTYCLIGQTKEQNEKKNTIYPG